MKILDNVCDTIDGEHYVVITDAKIINKDKRNEREVFSYYIELSKKKLKLTDIGVYRVTIEKL